MVDPIQRGPPALKTAGMPLLPTDALPAPGAWVLGGVLVSMVALVLGSSLRRPGPGELLLVVRRGRVARSGRTGWLARVPGLERFVVVPSHRQVLPLVARARSRDDVEIVVLADLTVAVEEVPDFTVYDDPAAVAVRAAEDALVDAVGDVTAATLVDHLVDLEGRLPGRISPRLLPGSVATGLAVTEVQAQLTSRLARELRTGGRERS